VTVVAVRFEGDGLPEPESGDGAGYEVYNVPDEEVTEPVAVPEPRAEAAPPTSHAAPDAPPPGRGGGLLLAAAAAALLALILAALL
jgi:hypothetical protein